jgi:CobW/HypB/UreG, nucleotide-binding domain
MNGKFASWKMNSERFPLTMVSVSALIVSWLVSSRLVWCHGIEWNLCSCLAVLSALMHLPAPASVAESLDAPEDLITMDNGCVCCSVRGDLVRTLGQLAKRRKDFHAILLETTGLADPAPIVYVGALGLVLVRKRLRVCCCCAKSPFGLVCHCSCIHRPYRPIRK